MSDHDSDVASGSTAGEPFLERWARRKARAREEVGQQPAAPPEEAPTGPGVTPAAADETAPTGKVQLPDLDTLDGNSDYSAFLSQGVDLLLRRRALRKLFHSPKFNVLDGLDDYTGDFTNFEPLGSLVTADMRHQLEQAARRVADALDSESRGAQAASATVAASGKDDSPAEAAEPGEGPEPDDATDRTA